ncbi:MAG: hypothetical protein ACTS85_03730 [Arsenophonus sp. NC-PG7-MAG3]
MHGLNLCLEFNVNDIDGYSSNCDYLLELEMILSVKLGLYISANVNMPGAYLGIGIRI